MATYNDVNTMRAGQRAQAEEAGQVMADQQIRQNKIGEMVQQRGREEMAQGQRNAFMNGAQRGMQQGQEEGVQVGLRMSEEAQSGVQQQQLQSMVMQGVDQLVQATQAGYEPGEVLAQMNFTEDPQTDGMIKQNIVQEFQKKMGVERGTGREQGAERGQGLMATANPELAQYGRGIVSQMAGQGQQGQPQQG